jgi:microcystin-dependent protein
MPAIPGLPVGLGASALPVGSVLAFAGDVTRLATPLVVQGFLVCDGRTLLVSEFPDLYDAIGTLYTPSAGTAFFSLPDLRGYFLRGVDPTGKVDPDNQDRKRADGATGPVVGSVQQSAFQLHEHEYMQAVNSSGAGQGSGAVGLASQATTKVVAESGGSAPLTSAQETRAINFYVYYIIKYTHTVTARHLALLSVPPSGR